jgi:predicted nucleic acid-binding protein
MMAVDTSVVVGAFATWHESHALAAGALAEAPRLPQPCGLEAYAVLTRLPPPHRAAPELVRDFLSGSFPGGWLTLSARRSRDLIEVLVDRGISGGASYDAVVALVASDAGATLVTLDQRARATYERMGAATRFLG